MLKQNDLEQRTYVFARDVRLFIKELNPTIGNIEDSKQVVRSSGSVGANYIESQEAVSKKDLLHRVKISRKDAKESVYWLKLISETNQLKSPEKIGALIKEAEELKRILSAIINSTNRNS